MRQLKFTAMASGKRANIWRSDSDLPFFNKFKLVFLDILTSQLRSPLPESTADKFQAAQPALLALVAFTNPSIVGKINIKEVNRLNWMISLGDPETVIGN